MTSPIRVLTAVPICDGHDSAINTINLEFIRNGIEVVYLGFHRYVSDIVRAAIQEDAAAIGISSYNGGHIDFFAEVVQQLKREGANDIAVFCGGAGKTTLIDELVLRFLQRQPKTRIAILSHDPSVIGEGALLGDRATMINSQDDRVFMRSMATRGQAGGLSPATESCLALLARSKFDYVIIETVGTGQEALPFRDQLVAQTILVMNPDYGARLQLQKIVMLDVADIVVVNKTDLERAKAALLEIEQRLTQNKRKQQIVATVAKRHRDAGVDELYDLILGTK